MDKTRINLANPQELLELTGIQQAAVDAIVRHRAEHGPISGATELTQILGPQMVTPTLLAHIDFQPADATAAEAPGA
jgi:DNA uptake protein ComE-like DNA-binding protein